MTINDLGGGPEEIEKKKILAALLREKQFRGGGEIEFHRKVPQRAPPDH